MTSLPAFSFSSSEDRRTGGDDEREASLAVGSGLVGKWLGALASSLAERATVSANPGQASEEVSRLRAQLADCVRENTALRDDLERHVRLEGELRRAREVAESLSRSTGGCLAAMSHEIRTPLNGVIGMANLLLESPLNAEQRELAQTVCRSGVALVARLNNLLDYSKGEAGALVLEHIDFDLAEQLRFAIELHAEGARRKGLKLLLDLAPAVPARVCGDPLRLRQVIVHLLSNATKFTERGTVVLRVRCDSASAKRARLYFEVSDTGVGISTEAQRALFAPFVQPEPGPAREFGGTGLGLAICRQLVGLMQGEIGARSEVGVGSTFWFTLGLDLALPAGLARTPTLPALEGKRVLIVDADATTRTTILQLCTAWLMRHGAAQSAATALAHLSWASQTGRPFDLVVIARRLPDGDGLELARTILADRLIPRPTLVLLTAPEEGVGRAQLDAHGIAASELKPVHPEKLRATLGRILTGAVKPPGENQRSMPTG